MKKTYVVNVMTNREYAEYMSGSWVLSSNLHIEAENAEEAITIAENNGWYVIDEKNVKTVEELEAERVERENERKERERKEEEKKAKAKAKREANEKAKAEAVGMTVEEYREAKRIERNIKKHEKEIEKLRKEIEYHERRIAEYRK